MKYEDLIYNQEVCGNCKKHVETSRMHKEVRQQRLWERDRSMSTVPIEFTKRKGSGKGALKKRGHGEGSGT